MMPNAAIEKIARELHAALEEGGETYVAALSKYWGGRVPLAHEPALPMDRDMSLEDMAHERRTLNRAFSGLMPDFRFVNVYSRVVGDVIYLFGDQSGTLKGGVKILSPLCSRFTIKDGKIANVVLGIDPESVQPLQEAFAAMSER